MGSETLRTQAERVGTELEGQQRRTMAFVEQTHEPPAEEHASAPGVLVVEYRWGDGALSRSASDGALMDGDWREVKLGLVGGWQHGHLQQPSYVAAREAAPSFARRLGAESGARRALDGCQRGASPGSVHIDAADAGFADLSWQWLLVKGLVADESGVDAVERCHETLQHGFKPRRRRPSRTVPARSATRRR